MSYLKSERKELRNMLERVYGINLREDDDILPILHFIHKHSAQVEVNVSETKKILETIKYDSSKLITGSASHVGKLFAQSQSTVNEFAKSFKSFNEEQKRESAKLISAITVLNNSVRSMPEIPPEVRVRNEWSFETKTLSFLWKYFAISFPLALSGFALASYFYFQLRTLKDEYNPNEVKWLYHFYYESRASNPKYVQEFEEQNPVPTN